MFVIVADIRKEALLIIQLAACTLSQQHTHLKMCQILCAVLIQQALLIATELLSVLLCVS